MVLRTAIIFVDNKCGRVSKIDMLLPPMFGLFDGKTGIIDNYNDDDQWPDACLGPLPPVGTFTK